MFRMRYLITFTSYGSHLHGDGRGSVDRHHNVPGGRYMDPSMERVAAMREQMDQEPYLLDRARRGIVFRAIREVCFYRKWTLLTVHVRTNHVHAVVDADVDPEHVMHDFKTYASRRLGESKLDPLNRKRWARHGSTRWLWNDGAVNAAIRYVVEEQGEPMEVYRAELP